MTIPWQTRANAKQRLAGEQGAVIKDWGGRIPTALLYPNRYYVGMSSLGFQAVYSLLNDDPVIVCERVFVESPRHLQREGLLSIESQHELWEFAVVAVSLSFELDYWNALAALKVAGIPLRTEERGEEHPLVIAGGPAVTANPEPMAPFIDAFIVGEAEPVLPSLMAAVRKHLAGAREDLLAALAVLPGVYVPRFYSVEHDPSGTVRKIEAKSPAGYPVKRQWARNLDAFKTASRVLTRDTELGDMYLIEVARGCSRQCRFCLAGFCFLPKRERSAANVVEMAREGLQYRDRIGLVGSAVSDYSAIDEVVGELLNLGAKVSVSSLRVDSLSPVLLDALVKSETRTLTMAPEVGSDRMSAVVGKGISQEQVVKSAVAAAKLGVKRFKLYYMVGLPTETDEDLQGIVDLTVAVQRQVEREQPGSHVTVNVSPFVPKAHTPFERWPMCTAKELDEKLAVVERGLRPKRVEVKGEGAAWSVVQGILARGDRRLADVLIKMSEHPSLNRWNRGMKDARLDEDFYLRRDIAEDEALPWDVVSTGVADRYLQSSMRKALSVQQAAACQGPSCRKCGVCPPDGQEGR